MSICGYFPRLLPKCFKSLGIHGGPKLWSNWAIFSKFRCKTGFAQWSHQWLASSIWNSFFFASVHQRRYICLVGKGLYSDSVWKMFRNKQIRFQNWIIFVPGTAILSVSRQRKKVAQKRTNFTEKNSETQFNRYPTFATINNAKTEPFVIKSAILKEAKVYTVIKH